LGQIQYVRLFFYDIKGLSNAAKDPIPNFKPLKRQGRAGIGTKDIYIFVSCLLCYLFAALYANALVTSSIKEAEKRSGRKDPWAPVKWIGIEIMAIIASGGLGAVVMICGFPLLFPFAVSTSAVLDYTLFYRSYDDNTVLDRFGRLAAAAGKTIIGALRDFLGWLYHVLRIRRNQVAITEDVEV
jgi:hypothetical protein